IFSGLVEYPLVLVLAAFLRAGLPAPGRARKSAGVADPLLVRADVAAALLLGGLAVLLRYGSTRFYAEELLRMHNVAVCIPVIICYLFSSRPARYGLGLGAVLLAGALYPGVHGRLLDRERSFFGIHRVTLDPTSQFRQLVHGNTVHGRQSIDPANR